MDTVRTRLAEMADTGRLRAFCIKHDFPYTTIQSYARGGKDDMYSSRFADVKRALRYAPARPA